MIVDPFDPPRTDRIFHALADPTRRDILVRTLQAESSVSGLARRYPMSFAAIQKHVAVLETAGLVTKQRRGREQLVSGNVDAIRDANLLLAHFESVWRDRMDRPACASAGGARPPTRPPSSTTTSAPAGTSATS